MIKACLCRGLDICKGAGVIKFIEGNIPIERDSLLKNRPEQRLKDDVRLERT